MLDIITKTNFVPEEFFGREWQQQEIEKRIRMFNLMPDTVKEDMPTRYLTVEYIEGQVQRNADKLIQEHNIDIPERIRYNVEYYIQNIQTTALFGKEILAELHRIRADVAQGKWEQALQRIYVANKGYMALFPIDIEWFQDVIFLE